MGSQTIAVGSAASGSRRGGLLDTYFYFGMSLLIPVVVLYGFSHTIDENLLHAVPARPWILWVHAFVFSFWLLFFMLQSALVRTHNIKLHRTLGWFGAGLGTLIPVLGISTAIVMDRFLFLHFHHPGYKTFFAIQLLDMSSFTVAFWLAVYWRKKPEYHRRLVLIATCALTSAAFARFPHIGVSWTYFCVDGLIVLGALRDLIVSRKVHAVYRYALPALIAYQTFMVELVFQRPQWWIHVTNAIMG
ncbi:MAG TPA: hypothetical protein VE195_05215 [Acidobacteriaceae bacterium]|nr:hypothetical protein [Acidobacteriaceae bacterium]